MSAKTFTAEDAKAANIVLAEEGKGSQAVHDLVVAYRANRRTGSANTKTRGEIRGNNKKMYRQKGTGNARHGTSKAPIFVGGGVAHGPRPRDYSKKVTKNTRRLALRRVLADVIAGGAFKVLPSFAISEPKTKAFVTAVTAEAEPKKVLIVAKSFDDTTYLAARNVQWAELRTAASVNVEELLHADTVLLVEDALETLAARTA
ncbi:50S ribosomal protein L4 [Haloferula sp. A504]|uniref:50S ribosomal protein L4 n=1 Tax=Haloferula sp. A504 TaxID=3373601 RepID=UPI0031C91B37|nr:50S ribosomal protein L4 [Verrucomicrobiaceae bacterium E54]